MRVGILCAGDSELAPFLPMIEEERITEKAMLRIHQGKIGGVEVAALFSGVCKVNAAIAAQILIDFCGADVIINAGTAGGMDERLAIFDTVIATECVYHDVAPNILTEFHPWLRSVFFPSDNRLLTLSRKAAEKAGTEGKVFFGRMVTGESFITDEGRDEINRQFSPLSVDMETAAVAHVCYANKVPFLSIRSITDTADHSGGEYFEANCEKASQIAANITASLLEEISKA